MKTFKQFISELRIPREDLETLRKAELKVAKFNNYTRAYGYAKANNGVVLDGLDGKFWVPIKDIYIKVLLNAGYRELTLQAA